MAKTPREKDISTLTHDQAVRLNNPTAEMASLYEQQEEMLGEGAREMRVPRDRPLTKGEERDRDMDRDPQVIWNGAKIRITQGQMKKLAETGEIEIGDAQLVWRGKDRQDWSDLVVNAPPLYIQEKVHPKAIIDDLKRRTNKAREEKSDAPDLFADFNGIADPEARAEFYQHTKHWQNRMILGDSLQVMASLAEREEMRGKVQCIYFDPPYGIKFNSNWQVSTISRDVKDGKKEDVSREPEQVKAFRDTWKDGIHSYLTYLRDRLMVARELLTESGSIFVQISDENVHRVRALMDEVFGEQNFCREIVLLKASAQSSNITPSVADFIIWYSKSLKTIKFRELYGEVAPFHNPTERFVCIETPDGKLIDLTVAQKTGAAAVPEGRVCRLWPTFSQTGSESSTFSFSFQGANYRPPAKYGWQTTSDGLRHLERSQRLTSIGKSLRWKVFHDTFPFRIQNNVWSDLRPGGFGEVRTYVVQTDQRAIQRCIQMTTDPGDLVLDPTCGSGTTAFAAEQLGRRWITVDTSRVALALARTRLMSARYPYYILADSREGRVKEQEVSGKILSEAPVTSDIRQGFVYERASRITLKSIANKPRST
ncbi:site-specific DNA-methyltransferase [Rhizobium sp. CBN3]|uniref:site-specific DNA-methyltransferase n=1 Tax=Rhizobium sp. CBN3 TaxID=3058045 RepID=UPI0026717713|nr:site-specific DNA-methyltransferase [Rhizobium sp. CBN3]MDO3434522.1 site-specific DNA-methyltransferase [Rhizobium sp. CBN3]